MELLKEDVLLFANLADINRFVSSVYQIIKDGLLSQMILLLRLLPKNVRFRLVFSQLIINIVTLSLLDLVHVLAKHSQNCTEDLAGIMLTIAKE
jgi:ABC-type antimicrobial peptide transport system permease subunit